MKEFRVVAYSQENIPVFEVQDIKTILTRLQYGEIVTVPAKEDAESVQCGGRQIGLNLVIEVWDGYVGFQVYIKGEED